MLIEVDGRQHYEYIKYFHKNYSGFLRSQERDRVKNKFALINNIPLIRIPYWDLDTLTFEKIFNIEIKMKFENVIFALFGDILNESEKNKMLKS